jgi:hypothetical protein
LGQMLGFGTCEIEPDSTDELIGVVVLNTHGEIPTRKRQAISTPGTLAVEQPCGEPRKEDQLRLVTRLLDLQGCSLSRALAYRSLPTISAATSSLRAK